MRVCVHTQSRVCVCHECRYICLVYTVFIQYTCLLYTVLIQYTCLLYTVFIQYTCLNAPRFSLA